LLCWVFTFLQSRNFFNIKRHTHPIWVKSFLLVCCSHSPWLIISSPHPLNILIS
jgi:hypothetical protein